MSIEQYPAANGVLTSLIWRKTAVGGETSLSGYDNATQALSYTPGQEQVYLNGILLVRGSDYTATNGTSITGLTALVVDDFIQINCYNNFSVASVPAASITGEVTNTQITSLATSKLTGTITNAQLAGSIANDKLTNSSITINGSAVALGGSVSLAGDIESVTASTGLSGGGSTGALTLTNTMATAIDAKGDLVVGTGADAFSKLGVGANGTVLTAASGEATGLSWAAPAGGGKVLQVVSSVLTTTTTIVSASMTDTGLTASITPTSNTSKIWVVITMPFWMVRTSSVNGVGFNLLRGATVIREQDASGQTFWHNYSGVTYAQTVSNFALNYLDSPATTSSTTYKVQGRLWQDSAGASLSVPHANTPVPAAVITLLEIGA
jgi:hypothetical protein